MKKNLVVGLGISFFSICVLFTYYSVNSDQLMIIEGEMIERVQINSQQLATSLVTDNKTTVSLPVIRENCEELIKTVSNTNRDYQAMITSFNHFLVANEINKVSRELIVQLAGISLNDYRQLSSKFNNDISTLTSGEGEIKDSSKYALTLAKAMSNKNYQPIIELLTSGDITKNSHFSIKTVLSAIVISNNDISISDLDMLMGSGLTPFFSDIVIMTKYNLSVEKIELALSYMTDRSNLTNTWYQHYQQQNLGLIAAKNYNYSLFSLWDNLGVPLLLESDDYNALDMITSPVGIQQVVEATKIFQLLANNNIYPYANDSLQKILEWLPEEIKISFNDYIAQQPIRTVSEWQNTQARKLTIYHQEMNSKKSQAEQSLKDCQHRFPITPDLINKSEDTLYLTERSSVQGLIKSLESIEAEQLNFHEKFISSMVETDTADIESTTEELNNEEAINIRLMLALRQNQPYEKLLALLQEGANLPSLTILILTINNNHKLIDLLKPHGLNLYDKDPQGDNALHYALRIGSSNAIFDKLITEGLNIYQGADLLRVALNGINTKGNTLYYITELVNNGLDITLSHKNLINQLSADDQNKYIQVRSFIYEQLN